MGKLILRIAGLVLLTSPLLLARPAFADVPVWEPVPVPAVMGTELTSLSDVAVSEDGKVIYLAGDNSTDFSVWRNVPSWHRVLNVPRTSDYIIRLAPQDEDVVYLAERNGRTIFHSTDGGETWSERRCGLEVQDLAVESATVLYALSREGKVARSLDAGYVWSEGGETGLDEDTGYTLVSAGQGVLLAGSTNGYVAYSMDGSLTWNRIPRPVENRVGKVQVVADRDFATNRTIYAASDALLLNVRRWQIGTSSYWTDIFRNVVPGGIYGLAVDGTALYALEYNPRTNQSTLWQCLRPTAASDSTSDWEPRPSPPNIAFAGTPRALKRSSGSFWAIKTNDAPQLYQLDDVMTELKLDVPESDYVHPVNTITGVASELTFSWERLAGADEYELSIATDEDFTALVSSITVASTGSPVTVRVGPDAEGGAKVNFGPGATYYWRIRVTEPLYYIYSETRHFSVAALTAAPPVVVEPPPPPVVTVSPPPPLTVPFPDIELPPDYLPPETVFVFPEPPAPATPDYDWVIIAIGVVLVMTVLFFIMLTMIDRFLTWWLRSVRYPWSRLRRRLLEAKYVRLPLPSAGSLEDIEACLRQVTWTMDGPLHLFDAVSYPQTVWAKKKDDCDGFAVLAAALLKTWEPTSRPVLVTAMLRPMRKSHTVCAFAVPGAGLWFFDNYSLRRGLYQTYAEIVQQVKGEARLVCWDVADPETLQTLEFHVVAQTQEAVPG